MDSMALMKLVHNGMKVIDSAGDDIGKVDFVQLPDDREPMDARPQTIAGSFINDVAELAAGGDSSLPPTIAARYRRHGYCHVDGKGWIDTDRYVESSQIASVTGNEVHLNVPKEDLLES